MVDEDHLGECLSSFFVLVVVGLLFGVENQKFRKGLNELVPLACRLTAVVWK